MVIFVLSGARLRQSNCFKTSSGQKIFDPLMCDGWWQVIEGMFTTTKVLWRGREEGGGQIPASITSKWLLCTHLIRISMPQFVPRHRDQCVGGGGLLAIFTISHKLQTFPVSVCHSLHSGLRNPVQNQSNLTVTFLLAENFISKPAHISRVEW